MRQNESPRVTLAELESEIVSEHSFTAAHGRSGALKAGAYVGRERPVSGDTDLAALNQVTICVLVLRNGAKVVGVNYGSIDPAQHDADRGLAEARKSALDQIWQLLGFRLRDRLIAEAA